MRSRPRRGGESVEPRSRSAALSTPPSPETELLLATARATLGPAERARLRAAIDQAPDWAEVIAAALAHGTAPFLCHHLLEAAPEALPPDLAEAAAIHRDAARAGSAAAAAQLLDLVAALGRAGIPALAFKGPALARQAHGEAGASLRLCRDLDLLIRPAEIDRCAAVLATLGLHSPVADLRPPLLAAYRAHNGQDIFFAAEDDPRLPVEPHWAFAPRSFGTRLDPGPLWPRAVGLGLAGGALRTLAPEDALLVAALHGGKEQWARLVWVADVAGLLHRQAEALDGERLLARARAAGIRRMLLLAVGLAEALLGPVPIPPALRRPLEEDRACAALVRQARARLLARPAAGSAEAEVSVFRPSRFVWRSHDDLAGRLRYLGATLSAVRPIHFRMLDLPARLAFAYPAVKVAHDYLALPLWRAGRTVLPEGWRGRRAG